MQKYRYLGFETPLEFNISDLRFKGTRGAELLEKIVILGNY